LGKIFAALDLVDGVHTSLSERDLFWLGVGDGGEGGGFEVEEGNIVYRILLGSIWMVCYLKKGEGGP
jgi:hypothetical protein